jgi:hypothetical protein
MRVDGLQGVCSWRRHCRLNPCLAFHRGGRQQSVLRLLLAACLRQLNAAAAPCRFLLLSLAQFHTLQLQSRAWLSYCVQGGLPVSISMTVQPTDQMSAARPCPSCLMTSGAIQ